MAGKPKLMFGDAVHVRISHAAGVPIGEIARRLGCSEWLVRRVIAGVDCYRGLPPVRRVGREVPRCECGCKLTRGRCLGCESRRRRAGQPRRKHSATLDLQLEPEEHARYIEVRARREYVPPVLPAPLQAPEWWFAFPKY